jgi:spore germination protein
VSRRTVVLVGLAAVVLLAVVAVTVVRTTTGRAPAFVAAAWLPVWDQRASDSLPTALDEGGVREVSPTWATVRADGGLTLTAPLTPALERMDAAGTTLLPVVQNFSDGDWQGDMLAAVLGDPELAGTHRRALVDTAVREEWDGIDLDYEALPAAAGPLLIDFLQALRDDLDEHDLLLSVTVPARTSDDAAASAYDYAAIGAVADQVRVMAYDHAWSGSPAGPIAPPDWVRDVVGYAVERIPEDKIMLGVGTYGYDWIGSRGVDLGAAEAAALAERVGAEPRWDDDAAAVTFSYEQDGQTHTVWYEDAESLAVKQEIALEAGLRGIAVWRLGGEDPQVWATIALVTGGTSR